ncbi:hypothetical protein DFH06DRAFT_1337471 [Mycena polygramma]|nr:hypothetical protein DFH06DRAFT_1337471 [Mycena polygramma]
MSNAEAEAAQERRRRIVSTWTREELLRWDEQRRARLAERIAWQQFEPAPHRVAEQATGDAQVAVAPDTEPDADTPDTEPDAEPDADVAMVASLVADYNDVAGQVAEYDEVLDALLPLVLLPVSHVRPEAGIRGAHARGHARAEAQRARLDEQARLDELTRARARTEFARVTLAMSRGVSQTLRGQAVLRARVRVEQILRERLAQAGVDTPPRRQRARHEGGSDDEEVVEGRRAPRDKPLNVNQLYVGAARPADCTTEERIHQLCAICRQVKSNPVSYRCGHSHCYTCIRIWLEYSWKCPECVTTMYEKPVRHWPEEAGIALDFPVRADETVVTYSFEGLTFPENPQKHAEA